ncbi:MAG: class I SAM-dependent methyltransferase [Bdellovibrio sp.]|nr:MAG: class I SAM-dependent methyltransferase [Bdellovibrio sp.]
MTVRPAIKWLPIDEEGYPYFGETRVTDQEVGLALLKNLKRHDNGTFETFLNEESYRVENFDDPLVVRTLEERGRQSRHGHRDDRWLLHFPYHHTIEHQFTEVIQDEWDRFHGRTPDGIPFVLSRAAQARFFDLVDEFDDDSVTIAGERINLRPWLGSFAAVDSSTYWSHRYQNKDTAFDLQSAAPALVDMLPRMKWPRSRVLVLGCGAGHDAAFFAEHGHLVTGVDFSAEAISAARKNYGDRPGLTWLQADAFQLPAELSHAFDIVFEHTCYCAIEPSRRQELVKVWLRSLAPRGHLMGVFFVHDKPMGPPFGGSEWEVRERLRRRFDFLFWGRWRNSPQGRQGTELFVLAQLKPGTNIVG